MQSRVPALRAPPDWSCYSLGMPFKIKLTDKQEDLVEKGLRASWVLAIGAVLTLVALVYLLSRITPPPLGQ